MAWKGKNFPSKTTICRWYADFKRGRTNIEDAERPGRPTEVATPENTKKILKILLSDQKVKLQEIADILKISKGTVFKAGACFRRPKFTGFLKRFWKGNKWLNQTQFWRYFLIYFKFEKKFGWHAATHYKPSYRESRRAPRRWRTSSACKIAFAIFIWNKEYCRSLFFV